MSKEIIKNIEIQIKETQNSLEDVSIERKKLNQIEAELFEIHRSSLHPIRELEVLSNDEQRYQELLTELDSLGRNIEQWADDKRVDLKRREYKLEAELDDLTRKRKKILEENGEIDDKDDIKFLRYSGNKCSGSYGKSNGRI